MKYRLYGRDGVTEREFQRLIEWRVVKLKQGEEGRRAVRVKRRIKKTKKNEDNTVTWYSSEDSRSCDSAYTIKQKLAYQDNEDGPPMEVNGGFEIQPLCPEIFGNRAARHSKAKRAKKSPLGIMNTISRNHIGGASYGQNHGP